MDDYTRLLADLERLRLELDHPRDDVTPRWARPRCEAPRCRASVAWSKRYDAPMGRFCWRHALATGTARRPRQEIRAQRLARGARRRAWLWAMVFGG